MERDTLSLTQLTALLFGALIGPVTELLPGTAVRGGVLGLMWVTAAVLLMACIGLWVGDLARGGGGLAGGLESVFGGVAGKAILLIYIVWFEFLFILRIRLSAQRLLGGGSRDGAVWFFLFVLGGMALWMAHGTLGALGRTAQLFFLALMLSVGGVLFLSLSQMERGNLLTVWEWSLEGVGTLVWPGVQAMGYGLFAGFLWEPPKHKSFLRPWLLWCLGAAVTLIVVQIVIMGCFGARLTESMQVPFFHLAKSAGIEGAFQRTESLIAAIWTFSDLLLLTGILWGMRRIGEILNPGLSSRTIMTVAVLGGVTIALAAFGGKVSAIQMSQTVGAAGNLFLGAGVPLAAVLILKVKKHSEKNPRKSEKSA